MEVHRSYMEVVRIRCPELYGDPDFMAWLDNPERYQATWHEKGEGATEFSDIFMTMEFPYEGSDSDMPGSAWLRIVDAMREAGIAEGTECVVWLQNL